MVYIAHELLSKLETLTLVGQEDGELEFVGTDDAWDEASRRGEEMADLTREDEIFN